MQELDYATSELASQLRTKFSLSVGDRALLVFFPGLEFTASLLACFKAGIIAVPVFPPNPRKLRKDLDHFVSIQKSSGAKFALTHSQYNFAKKIADTARVFQFDQAIQWPTLQWIVVDGILSKGKSIVPKSFVPYASKDDDVAFLQYTSGSTSEPKGVMITHGNLSHNLTMITKELQVDTATINVSWLPQYHDMGLIGEFLTPIFLFNKFNCACCING